MSNLRDLQLGLLEKGVIDLDGVVDMDMHDYVRECMTRLILQDNPPISIRITSQGGSVIAGLHIYDLLRLYPNLKTATVFGTARSIAVIVLQACEKREAARNSTFLLHYVRQDMISLHHFEDVAKMSKIKSSLHDAQNKIISILEERTKKPREYILKLCDRGELDSSWSRDDEFTAEQALDAGLIDTIV